MAVWHTHDEPRVADDSSVAGGSLGLLWLISGLVLASLLCVLLAQFRHRYGADPFHFLDWNLFLAWVPLVSSLLAYECARRGRTLVALPLGVVWLLFFPNAPYVLTDFIHLQQTPAIPLWYDGLMLSAFAWTSLLVGFVSLYLMQTLWRHAAGAIIGWIGVVVVLALASVGVYLGRFIGLNSWDALLHPGEVAHILDVHLSSPQSHPRRAESLVVLTSFLLVAYLVFCGFAGLRPSVEHDWPARGRQRRSSSA